MSRQIQAMTNQAHAIQPATSVRSSTSHQRLSDPNGRLGNQTVQRLLRDGVMQAKLSVNQPGDRFEQEADRVAEQVMRMPEAGPKEVIRLPSDLRVQRLCPKCDEELHRKPVAEGTASAEQARIPRIQRVCPKCQEELHRKESASAQPSQSAVRLPHGSGLPLPESARSFFEPRFGRDFGHVRIHNGSDADESARSLNALAYTTGSDIVFAKGQYSPNTGEGQQILAHELTHVIQQGNLGGIDKIQRKCKDDVPRRPGCELDPNITPPSNRFLFNVNCDDFAPGQEDALARFARSIPSTATIRIVGVASFDGAADLNQRLACSRGQQGLAVIERSAPFGVQISVRATVGGPSTANDPTMRAVAIDASTPPRPAVPPPAVPRPPVVKPSLSLPTPCERCNLDFDDCLGRSEGPLSCLARRSVCLRACKGTSTPSSAFAVCARRLQPPVEWTGSNHAYVETPTRRYAIITPCTDRKTFVLGGIALKTDRSPDPCGRLPTCIECVPKPGISDLESCFESRFTAYAAPSLHRLFGPNSNTFAGTLARACCANMATQPAALGDLPGWDDPPAPPRTGPCPSGSPVC